MFDESEPRRRRERRDPEERQSKYMRAEFVALLSVLLVIAGIITEWLNAQLWHTLPIGMGIGIGIIMATIVACCGSLTVIGGMAARMPEYSEMELELERALDYYNNREWERALEVLKELMGPAMNHKRALYYAAKCYEQLDDWEMVKLHCKKYLQMQPKDKEVWELLSTAHKRLFEYEDAELAASEAAKLE